MPSIHYFQNGDTSNSKMTFKPVFIGAVCSVIALVVCVLAISFVFLSMGVSQKYIPLTAKIIIFVSAFIGGLLSGKNSRSNGWLFGILSCLCMIASIILASFFMGVESVLSLSKMPTIIFLILTSALGGVFGINLKPTRKVKK